jgi:hypothetical protein
MKRWVIGIAFASLAFFSVSVLLFRASQPSEPKQTSQPDIDALLKDLPLNQIEQRQLFSFGDEVRGDISKLETITRKFSPL